MNPQFLYVINRNARFYQFDHYIPWRNINSHRTTFIGVARCRINFLFKNLRRKWWFSTCLLEFLVHNGWLIWEWVSHANGPKRVDHELFGLHAFKIFLNEIKFFFDFNRQVTLLRGLLHWRWTKTNLSSNRSKYSIYIIC